MLFIQGTRDKLAEHDLMFRVVTCLGQASSLLTIQHADHGFDVLVRSGRKHVEVMAELLDGFAGWTSDVLQARHEVRLRHGNSILHFLGLSSRMALVSTRFETQWAFQRYRFLNGQPGIPLRDELVRGGRTIARWRTRTSQRKALLN
jgi:hypothetical protein